MKNDQHRTALDNVIEGPIHVKGEKPAQAREYGTHLLERVGPGGRIDHSLSHLSRGQGQRVAIARDVADRILFLDRGVIVEQGKAKEVLTAPQYPRMQDFLRRVLNH